MNNNKITNIYNKIKNMKNFAILKESIYNEVINCLKEDRPKAKKLVKGYVNILKQYPTLKEAFHIINNFETGYFKNDDVKHGFIIENLNAIKRLNKEELRVGLDSLDQFIKGNNIQYVSDLNVLSEKLSNLMLNINKVNKSVENNKTIEYIIESVLSRNTTEVSRKPVNHKIFKDVATQNYQKKYANLSETEKRIVKSFFSGDKNSIIEQYNNLTSEIKESIDTTIKSTEDKDTKIKLYEVKDKLLTPTTDITLEHFNKLLQLKENLK